MKLLSGLSIVLFIVMWWATLTLVGQKEDLKEQNAQLRRERDMYDSLYRTANTRLYQFQDSINKHCICK